MRIDTRAFSKSLTIESWLMIVRDHPTLTRVAEKLRKTGRGVRENGGGIEGVGGARIVRDAQSAHIDA